MDKDELLRLKQISGLAELFADKEFSLAKDLHSSINFYSKEKCKTAARNTDSRFLAEAISYFLMPSSLIMARYRSISTFTK